MQDSPFLRLSKKPDRAALERSEAIAAFSVLGKSPVVAKLVEFCLKKEGTVLLSY